MSALAPLPCEEAQSNLWRVKSPTEQRRAILPMHDSQHQTRHVGEVTSAEPVPAKRPEECNHISDSR